MKLSEVKRRNRIIGVLAAAVLFQLTGLDQLLRRIGGMAFSFIILLALFFAFPIAIEYIERKFVD